VLLALPAGWPVAGDDHQPVVGVDDLEDDLEDVAGGVAQVHDERGLVDHAEFAVVVGDGDADAAQVGRRVGVGGDLECGLPVSSRSWVKTSSPSTSATPSSSGPLPPCGWLSTAARLARLAA
jgi:hypothetical protein